MKFSIESLRIKKFTFFPERTYVDVDKESESES